MRAARQAESTAFVLLQIANPVDVAEIRRELGEERLAAARARALRAALPRRTAYVRRIRAARAAGGVAVVTVAVVGLLVLFQSGGEPASPLRVLNAAAGIAAREPAATLGPGQYIYVRQRSGVVGGREETVEWWIAADGSGRMARRGPQAIGVWRSANGKVRTRDAKAVGPARAPRVVTFGPGRFSALYARINPGVLEGRIDDLTPDPAALESVLRRKLEGAADFNPDPAAQSLQLLQVVEEVLANPLASPELRSAAYRVAAQLEGVTVQQGVEDPVGRPATAIALCSASIPARYDVFFDPATSATLGTREVSPGACSGAPPHPAGLTSFTVYSEEGTVNSIHDRP
jgi:hypothetical protein